MRLHAVALDPPGPPVDPPVVMLHGLLIGNLTTWYFTAAPALARRRRVLLYDLRGHGRSDVPPSGYDVATQARDLAGVVACLPRVALVGHSYGALIALRFALDHPNRVDRLVLVEAPLPPARMGETAAFARRAPADMAAALPAELRAVVGAGGRRARRLVAQLARLSRDTTLLADVDAEGDVDDAELARVSCRALVVCGRRSACAPAGERLARAIPRADFVVLDGGHYLHLDQPRALTGAIARFFDG
ncbi:MAG: alpha/beta hydrolase [Deltaproteobacteria bacterium]|nr:MAG: alpha/beta hydrolase [Deltaproteobacteria bacterium]